MSTREINKALGTKFLLSDWPLIWWLSIHRLDSLFLTSSPGEPPAVWKGRKVQRLQSKFRYQFTLVISWWPRRFRHGKIVNYIRNHINCHNLFSNHQWSLYLGAVSFVNIIVWGRCTHTQKKKKQDKIRILTSLLRFEISRGDFTASKGQIKGQTQGECHTLKRSPRISLWCNLMLPWRHNIV